MDWKDKDQVREWKKQYNKRYRLENRVNINRKIREWKELNKEKVKISAKKYRQKTLYKSKRWRDKNKENIKKFNDAYYVKNKQVILSKSKKYRNDNKEKIKQINHIYYLKNKKKLKDYQKKYYSTTKRKQRRKFITDRWRNNNKEKYLKNSREYISNRKKKDNSFKIKQRLRHRLWVALKNYSDFGKKQKSDEYGINYQKIIEHLKPFPEDMAKHHIDHIVPLSKFDFNDPQQIKWAFAPENHQWLTDKENLKKGNRYIYIKQ